VIAPSVMGPLPDNIDVDRVEIALVEVFPSYRQRFAAAHAMRRGFLSLRMTADERATCLGHVPVLTLISTDNHPVLSKVAGGSSAERVWSERCPHAMVLRIKSDHATIPYRTETGWNIIHFFADVSGQHFRPDVLGRGCSKFLEADEVMESARQSFRRAWELSNYAKVDFRTGPLDSVFECGSLSLESRRRPAVVRALLSQIGVDDQMESYKKGGYEDIAFLLRADRGMLLLPTRGAD